MKIKVRYFGQFRDIAGLSEEELETKDGVTVTELRDLIKEKYDRIAVKEVLVAINNSFVPLETVVKDDDEVAIFPPVSGG